MAGRSAQDIFGAYTAHAEEQGTRQLLEAVNHLVESSSEEDDDVTTGNLSHASPYGLAPLATKNAQAAVSDEAVGKRSHSVQVRLTSADANAQEPF
jgi:hypothetical protein